MKVKLGLFLFISGAVVQAAYAQQGNPISESEVAKMPPQRRVEEYFRELREHGYGAEYERLLSECLVHDGVLVVPYLVRIIDQYDPAQAKGNGKDGYLACYAAEGLLSAIDENTVRLRGTPEGMKAIDAIRRLAARLVAAKSNTREADGEESQHYKTTLIPLVHFEGTSWFDVAIKDTLELKKDTKLSNNELLSFINYLIARDPRYPSWSKKERYKDMSKVNEAGNPLQYTILKDIEPFSKMYLDYKAARGGRAR